MCFAGSRPGCSPSLKVSWGLTCTPGRAHMGVRVHFPHPDSTQRLSFQVLGLLFLICGRGVAGKNLCNTHTYCQRHNIVHVDNRPGRRCHRLRFCSLSCGARRTKEPQTGPTFRVEPCGRHHGLSHGIAPTKGATARHLYKRMAGTHAQSHNVLKKW